MVVPFLCLIIIAILHFGKVMNYWLDLNHVASEGRARLPSTRSGDDEYDTSSAIRLETGELRAGGTTSIPAPATIAVCLPEGGDVGDPVTVQVVRPGYSLPFIGADDHARGTATMRSSSPPTFAAAGACDELDRGTSIYIARTAASSSSSALLIPSSCCFLALSVDIGNWWVHRRHLQTAGRRGRARRRRALRPVLRATGRHGTARSRRGDQLGGGAASSYNGQVAERTRARYAPLPEQDVPAAQSPLTTPNGGAMRHGEP